MNRHADTRRRAYTLGILVLVLAATLALGLAIGLAVAAVARVTVPVVARTDPPLRVTTYNALRTRAPGPVRSEIATLATRSDVLLLQETPNGTVNRPPGFGVYRPPGQAAGRPILWRTSRLAFLRSGSVLAQRWPIHRRTSWVTLRERTTGKVVTVVDFHGLPHVERRGHPYRLPRVRQYRASLVRLGPVVDRSARVIVAGDWNVNRRADNRVRWHGFPAVWARGHRLGCAAPTVPTSRRSSRTIDYLFHRGAVPLAVHVRHGYGSDHRPVTVAYRLR